MERRMNDTERVLVEMQQTLATAWTTGDRATIERIIAPDWTAIGPTGEITTRSQLTSPVFDQHTQHIEALDIVDVIVRVFHEAAVVTGRTHVVGRFADMAYEARIRFTDFFVRRDGRWEAVASHATVLPTER
jgi:hypothetical protein